METMYRFEAFYKDGSMSNYMIDSDGGVYAIEARFNIIADSEERALELIEEQGEKPEDYYLVKSDCPKDQLGRYFQERIIDARI